MLTAMSTQGYRQVGKARVSESRIRWFESSYPCHMIFRPLLENSGFFVFIHFHHKRMPPVAAVSTQEAFFYLTGWTGGNSTVSTLRDCAAADRADVTG